MPRGNDPDAARELRERYDISGNAEQLIQSNRHSTDRIVATASTLPEDEEATKKLDLSAIDAPGDVVSARVRGDYISFVWEDDQGVKHNGAVPVKGSRAEKRLKETGELDQLATERKQLEEAVAADAELREAREKAAAKVEEAQQEADRITAEKAEEVAKAQAEAAEPKGKAGNK